MKPRKRETKERFTLQPSGYRASRTASTARDVDEPSLHTVGDFCEAMQSIAPTGLAQSWDNVGLLAGDTEAVTRRVMLAIDLTRPVLEEAIAMNADLLLAYHPPIFKPVSTLLAQSNGMDGLVFECIRAGMAIYSTHTALDAAGGGTNDVLAEACGADDIQPLGYVDAPQGALVKIVVYVPTDTTDTVAEAMFQAGAGHIGKYSHCSFRSAGTGTFLGGPDANPAIGERGRLEHVEEFRLETIVPQIRLAGVVSAMRSAHPYEEPAFDLYNVRPEPAAGIGRIGSLSQPVTISSLAKRLGRLTQAVNIQIVGMPQHRIDRVIVVAGAAGGLPFQHPLTSSDAIITGEMRHHDALTIRRIGCGAIVLGHWASERPVLAPLAARLSALLPNTEFQVSRSDADPFS